MTDLYQQVVRQRWGSSRVYTLYLVLGTAAWIGDIVT